MPKKRASKGQQGRTERDKIGPKAVKEKVFSKPKDSPFFPKKFKPREGPQKISRHKIQKKDVLAKLLRIENDVWQKVYLDGFDKDESKISVHYFESKSGKFFFDIKEKKDWSNK